MDVGYSTFDLITVIVYSLRDAVHGWRNVPFGFTGVVAHVCKVVRLIVYVSDILNAAAIVAHYDIADLLISI